MEAQPEAVGVEQIRDNQKLLRGKNKDSIVISMFATLVFSALFLTLAGALLARLPLRAKLLPLLRRAR
ncbi:MAG: hypothetical protein Q8L44_05400 [Sulfuritalea sp.]|nr:hypothetical protein [Sulfuritalea sp.]